MMRATRRLMAARQPTIKFLGKRKTPERAAELPSPAIDPPRPHPASPTHSLPSEFESSFKSYRDSAQQHGPLAKSTRNPRQAEQHQVSSYSDYSSGSDQRSALSSPRSSSSGSAGSMQAGTGTNAGNKFAGLSGGIGRKSGASMGSFEPDQRKGEVWDRRDLPTRFRRMAWTSQDWDLVESGGASVW